MTLTKVKKRHQITLPKSFREELDIQEGDYLEIIKKDNQLVLIPQVVIPKSQRYFYTKEWQKDETEVNKQIAEGKIAGPFSNTKDLLKELKS